LYVDSILLTSHRKESNRVKQSEKQRLDFVNQADKREAMNENGNGLKIIEAIFSQSQMTE
jgi:hypothetical protein